MAKTNNEISNSLVKALDMEFGAEYFRSKNDESCVTIRSEKKYVTYLIEQKEFRDFIANIAMERDVEISRYIMEKTFDKISAKCLKSGIKKEIYLRVAKHENKILIDLTNDDYSIVEVSESGWKIIENRQVAFIRKSKQRALPNPVPTDKEEFLKLFKSIFNLYHPEEYLLVLTFILNSLCRDFGSYAILVMQGSKGTGKSVTTNRIKQLVDPTLPNLYAPPENPKDLFILANSSYLISLDNLSGLNAKLADAFCRISTGGGFSQRELYTSDNELVYDLQRPTILNGIDTASQRPDFLDRCVTIQTGQLNFENRKSESRLNSDFIEMYPKLTGGIYTILAEVVKTLPSISDKNLQRMTEFSRIGIALEKTLNLSDGIFLETYSKNLRFQSESAFEEDELCLLVHSILLNRKMRIANSTQNTRGNLIDFSNSFKDRSAMPQTPFIIGTMLDIKKELLKTAASKGGGASYNLNSRTTNALSRELTRKADLLKQRNIVFISEQRTSQSRTKILGFSDDVQDYYSKLAQYESGHELL